MFAKSKLLAVGIIVFLLSCNQTQSDSKGILLSETLSVSDTIPASAASVENSADTTRKFIRTADLRFRVTNVFKATNRIEDITAKNGGFVTFTNLTSSTEEIKRRAISEDSLLETSYYSVNNSITIRVPNVRLDTVLKEISQNIDHLDYRIIKADDVSLRLLSNHRSRSTGLKLERRIETAINKSGRNLNHIVDAEKMLYSASENSDAADIANLGLSDQINFSTVSLSVYQRQTTKTKIIPTDKYVDEYTPAFGSQLLASFKTGLKVLEFILISVLKIWPVIIIAFLMGLIYRRNIQKLKIVK